MFSDIIELSDIIQFLITALSFNDTFLPIITPLPIIQLLFIMAEGSILKFRDIRLFIKSNSS